MKITQLDLFSGIGGFHLGFKRAGYEVTSFFSEIDKHAIAVYKHQFPNSTYVGSVTNVRGSKLPSIDLITFGSPCQDFSLAGKRKGMEGQRSSLILQAIRLIHECQPRVFIWENVKGTFSSNNGADFWAIIQAFANIGGYRLEWELINTSWFLPQNRERIYLVGYSTITKRNWRGVFPIAANGRKALEPSIKQIGVRLDSGGKQPYQQDRVYDADGIIPALNQGKSDLILRVKSATSQGYEIAEQGDSINLSQSNSETRRGRGGKQKAQTLETSCNQAVVQPIHCIGGLQKNAAHFEEKSPALTSAMGMGGGHTPIVFQPNYTSKALNETIENNELIEGEPKALDLYNRSARDESPALTEPHHNSLRMFDGYRIRRLTPIECERLQGFPDNHTAFGNYDGEVKPMSNTQRYKQCGNAVTVDVVQAVANQCKPLFK